MLSQKEGNQTQVLNTANCQGEGGGKAWGGKRKRKKENVT